jgi:acyl-CoA synthetase (AMP-forming)/AMP-acid ligase II
MPLVSGGRLVIASRDDAHDPNLLMELMRKFPCNVMQATPTTWRALIEAGWSGSRGLKILCGGESLPGDLAQQLLARCGELWNVYGPTETTIWSTVHRLRAADETSIPIGRPIANTQVFVLDANKNLLPQGALGELYIGGAGLARGYLRRPELTQWRFVPSPFEPHQRLYRTGDMARWLRDGTLECLGRADDTQVKIRGFRIELGEVEAVLARHETVKQCVAVTHEGERNDKTLVVYLEPYAGVAPTVSDLRAYLKKDLPDYMIPSTFVVLDKLPLTPNGKVDRKALPHPEERHADIAEEFAAPRDPLEQALTQIWSKVLRVRPVELCDNFFELGGHSLLAMRIS